MEKAAVIKFSGAYTFDLASKHNGVMKQENANLGNVDLKFDFDTERLNLWNRVFFLSIYSTIKKINCPNWLMIIKSQTI